MGGQPGHYATIAEQGVNGSLPRLGHSEYRLPNNSNGEATRTIRRLQCNLADFPKFPLTLTVADRLLF